MRALSGAAGRIVRAAGCTASRRGQKGSCEGATLGAPAEVADYLLVPLKTLYQWRYQGKGPRTYRVDRRLLYRWEKVGAWLESTAAGGSA